MGLEDWERFWRAKVAARRCSMGEAASCSRWLAAGGGGYSHTPAEVGGGGSSEIAAKLAIPFDRSNLVCVILVVEILSRIFEGLWSSDKTV